MADDSTCRYALSADVHQATGMLMERLGCSIEEALEQLLQQVEVSGKTLDEVAADVIRFGQ